MAITLDEKYDYEDDLPQYTKLASRSRNRQLIAALATACSIALLITHGGGCVHSLMKNEKVSHSHLHIFHFSVLTWLPAALIARQMGTVCRRLCIPMRLPRSSKGLSQYVCRLSTYRHGSHARERQAQAQAIGYHLP